MEPTKPMPRDIVIRAVCEACGVHRQELGSKCRHPTVVAAREIATHLLRKHTHMSYPEIAREIGRPNHSSVITAHRRFLWRLTLTRPNGRRMVNSKWDFEDMLARAELLAQHAAPGCGAQEAA